jgi:hypothetical protein
MITQLDTKNAETHPYRKRDLNPGFQFSSRSEYAVLFRKYLSVNKPINMS